MSWMKKRTPGVPSPAPTPPVQIYNPNQHSNQENQWQQQQQPQNWYNPGQQQQQPSAVQQQGNYWQQNYANPQNVPQRPPPQNIQRDAVPPVPPNPLQNPNNQSVYQTPNAGQIGGQQPPAQQQQQGYNYNNGRGYEQQAYTNSQYNQQYENNAYNSQEIWGNWGWGDEDNNLPQQPETANTAPPVNPANIADSFANDQSWNWSLDDKNQTSNAVAATRQRQQPDVDELFPKVKVPPPALPPKPAKNSIPNLARAKLETPQWSTESQVSQESSDDVLHTSGSDKSRVLSQSSTSPSGAEPPMPPMPTHHRMKNASALDGVAEGLARLENRELSDGVLPEKTADGDVDPPSLPPPPSVPGSLPPPSLVPGSLPPPAFASSPLGGPDDSTNPYKRTAGISHRSANKFRQAATPPNQPQQAVTPPFPPPALNADFPLDGSERPAEIRPYPHRPESGEAPMNDRNQYLETGQLTESGEYLRENVARENAGDVLPPPGLHRMVPGQMGRTEDGGGRSGRGLRDEPPPGLSRMVLGQNETSAVAVATPASFQDLNSGRIEPPEGLRRMVPGESSSPETSLRPPEIGAESEPELARLATQSSQQPRSATIGADTPPAVRVIDDDDPPQQQQQQQGNGGGGGRGGESNRRHYAEGQPQDADVDNLAGSVRNLTVGENLTDGQTSNTSVPVTSSRRHSVQESSDSEPEHKKPPRGPPLPRDRRSAERGSKVARDKDRDKRRERDRDRGSPDDFRDRKDRSRRYRDRRYEDDTDYFSDKEKEKRAREDRDREFERKYSSLKKDKDKRRRGDRADRDRDRDYYRDPRRDYYYKYDDDYDNRSRPSSRSDSVHESYRERRHEKDHRERDRRAPRDRERDRERYRHREGFNPYQSGAYDPYSTYYQQYQYYENLRRTNPQAYAEWYRKYYQQAAGSVASFAGEDRASVHSGRSSANDDLAKDRYTRHSFYSENNLSGYYGETRPSGHYCLDTSSYSRFDQTDASVSYPQQSVASQRLTPAKFATAHLKASISSGRMVKILPSFPLDGDEAAVELTSLAELLADDEEFKELNVFPGPLVRGVTHKKTIIEYCESKIRGAGQRKIVDVDSYVLMWELMILLIRQNGMVVGTDIAELLLKDSKPPRPEILQRPASVSSNLSSNAGDNNVDTLNENTGSAQSVLKEEEVTSKFREYLLYGSEREALEWAMKNGLWGHALFLASKLDKRTYANVMMRFANGLPMNDPLQTLYQLLSGKVPAAVTCVSDERWGDWRPHLAMILSNSGQRPDLNRRSVTALGDTLRGRGCPYAARFCYLMARVGFGGPDAPDAAEPVLLGAEEVGGFPRSARSEAVHMTEVYEYACSLNEAGFVMPEFQVYKFLLATRLADRGLLEKALQYLEKISSYIVGNPSAVETDLVEKVCSLADRLKFYDPVDDVVDESEFGSIAESNRPDNSWLKDLRAVLDGHYSGTIRREIKTEVVSPDDVQAYEPDLTLQGNQQLSWQQQQQQQVYQQSLQSSWQAEQLQQMQQQQQVEQVQQLEHLQQAEHQLQTEQLQEVGGPHQQHVPADISPNQYQSDQQQQGYWHQPQQPQWGDNQYGQVDGLQQQQQQSAYYQQNAQVEPEPQPDPPAPEPAAPQISMPGQKRAAAYDDEPLPHEAKENAPAGPKLGGPNDKQQQSAGWFGGIFSKLALKPKNQIKLPDDKNPKIVWDQEKKRWVNVDEDPNDPSNNFKPPPKMSDLIPRASSAPQPQPQAPGSYGGGPGAPAEPPMNLNRERPLPSQNNEGPMPVRAPQPNIFKMQRGRNLKNSYVDVFNPGGGRQQSGTTSLPAEGAFGGASAHPHVNFFVPAPVTDRDAPTDFLTPAPAMPRPADAQPQ